MIALACIIALTAAIGLVISFGQRPLAKPAPSIPTPFAPQPITPSPVPRQPQAGNGFSLADDLASHDIVLFGGVGDYASTWLWDGAKWTLAHPRVSPQGRFGASEAYDPQTKTVLLFGGRLEPGTPVNDTWAWNGSTWQELDGGAAGPQPGEGSDMAWDCVGPSPATGAANTTWSWSGGTWTLVPTPTAPIDGSTMALDPAIDRLVLCACDASPAPKRALSMWEGAGWVSLPAIPPPLVGGTEITDADRGELLLFGSPNVVLPSGRTPVEVWSLVRSTWSQLGRIG